MPPPHSKPILHRAPVLSNPTVPSHAISIDEFIESRRAGVSSSTAAHVRRFSSRIHEKLLTEQARGHADLHEGVRLLLRVLDWPEAASDPLPVPVAEAVVALDYVLRGADVIPDWVPEIGLTDDARVVACVLARNPSLRG